LFDGDGGLANNLGKLLLWNGVQHSVLGRIQLQFDGRCRRAPLREQQVAELRIHRGFLDQHFDTPRDWSSITTASWWPAANDGRSYRFLLFRAHIILLPSKIIIRANATINLSVQPLIKLLFCRGGSAVTQRLKNPCASAYSGVAATRLYAVSICG
jgi:hypothetical protein